LAIKDIEENVKMPDLDFTSNIDVTQRDFALGNTTSQKDPTQDFSKLHIGITQTEESTAISDIAEEIHFDVIKDFIQEHPKSGYEITLHLSAKFGGRFDIKQVHNLLKDHVIIEGVDITGNELLPYIYMHKVGSYSESNKFNIPNTFNHKIKLGENVDHSYHYCMRESLFPIPNESEFINGNEFNFIDWDDNYQKFKVLLQSNDRLRMRKPLEEEPMEIITEVPKVIPIPKSQPKPLKSRRSQGF